MEYRTQKQLLSIILTPKLGQTRLRRLIDAVGSIEAAAEAMRDVSLLRQALNTGAKTASDIADGHRKVLADDLADRELEAIDKAGAALLAMDDPAYPRLLRLIDDPPYLLWMRGRLVDDDALALAMVGSRRCTHYGREQASLLAGGCARTGLTIVSGGAYGIDAAAHRGCLEAGGRTVAVIGSGLARPYPNEHGQLFDRIVSDDAGAVLSELPMHTAPHATAFPSRNRIISGMSLATLVVEAAMRSGALITARLCVDDHGRELLALPGRADSKMSQGTNHLIRQGSAALVTSVSDILDSLGEAGRMLQSAGEIGPATETGKQPAGQENKQADEPNPGGLFTESLGQSQATIMKHLGNGRTLDELVALTQLPIAQLQSELTLLELHGHVKRVGAMFAPRR